MSTEPETTKPDGMGMLNTPPPKTNRTAPPRRGSIGTRNPAKTVAPHPPVPSEPAPSVVDVKPPATPSTPAATAQEVPPERRAAVAATTRRSMLALTHEQDRYLDEARILGITGTPKVDVSRSAAVRLAMERMMAELTPQQLRDEIARRPKGA